MPISFPPFAKVPIRRQLVLAEALFRTLIAWGMIRLLPFRLWRRWLGQEVPLDSLPRRSWRPKHIKDSVIGDVVWAHAIIEARLEVVFTCLMIGFSSRAMLRRRGYDSLLVLGVGRSGDQQDKNLAAHAWVVYRDWDISGGTNKHEYSAVSAYR
ncbi:MAG: lasso peptide biosynthesis B2 protein [Pseudomonadota bacterium]